MMKGPHAGTIPTKTEKIKKSQKKSGASNLFNKQKPLTKLNNQTTTHTDMFKTLLTVVASILAVNINNIASNNK